MIEQARERVIAQLGPATPVARVAALRESPSTAGRIDHTLLKPEATPEAIATLCAEAREHHFASVCVNSRWVPLVAGQLAGSGVLTCSVVGFPLGAMSTQAKAFETRWAVENGADEIDMVITVGSLLADEFADVAADIEAVVDAASGRPVKVIIETCLLDDLHKAIACVLAQRAGASYVKTSTGFNGDGATVEDIALMRAVVGDELGVQASGGVRTGGDAQRMLAAGADRIGASASIAIIGAGQAGGSGY